MTTVVFDIPLIGHSGHHQENLSKLDELIGDEPERLIIKLRGPGGLAAEAVLAYHDLLGTLTLATQVITISYSNLIGADLVLFLLGSPRDIRPTAWAYVFSSPIWAFESGRGDGETRGTTIAGDDRAASSAVGWIWDYQRCLQLIGEHIELEAILDRRLDVADLKEHLLIDCGGLDALLIWELSRMERAGDSGTKAPSEPGRQRRDERGRNI